MATCVATVLDNSGIEINGINFPDMHFREYVRQFDTDGNGYLNENEIKAVSTISIDSHGINSLGGIEYFTELIELYCPYNQLTSLDVSKNTKLKYLNCDGNQITSLITGNNTFLQSICCGQNKLKSLNLSENTGLKELYCYDNQLTSLDIRDNTGLEWLSCGYNQLTSLVVSQNTYLTTLWCANNQLAILDVSKNTELKYLACYKNQLTALDISKNTKLMQLDCKDNRLTTLDISNCPVLVSLVEKTEFNGTGWQDGEYYWLYAGLDAHNIITDTETSNDIVSVTGVTLNKTSLTLKEKETETLSATVIPFNAYNQKITWSSSDSNVVKVDANGKVTAVKAGKTTITVMTEDGGKTATCTVTVVAAPVAVTSVKLNKTSVQITEGETLTLAAMIAPTNAANQKVTWNSSDRKVAKVDAKGKVTAVSYGEATITVTTEDGKKTAICTVTVEPKDKIKAYVTRCYSIILGREPDKSGLDMWDNELRSGLKAAAEIIEKFVNSPEFVNKNYSKGDAVEILYKTMLDRGSDPKGKKNWVDKLEAGRSFAAVINGFCESPEFTKICRTYGIKAGSVIDPDNDTRTPDEKIRAFVQRCYRMILNRDPDEGGMNTWFNELKSGRKAASEIIDKFVNSPEYIEKNHTESESVEILYNAMLGRGSDPAGKANWVTKLENGQPFAVVINGFCVSKEFTGICASYGIEPGTVKVQALSGMAEEEALSMLAYKAKKPITKKSETNPTRVEIINPSDTIDMNIGTAVQAVYINEEKAKEFISRCYQCILGREASAAELDNWIGQMTNGTKTPDQIARGFLFSNEFKGKNISNEDLVKILYKVYMNRDADPEGLKTWTEKLDGGTELKALLDAFAKTSEFKKVVNEMSK